MITENLTPYISSVVKELLDFNQGIEKEGLRVQAPSAKVSKRAHHKDLGHKLTHPYITTDYSEHLLEFITPVFNKDKNLQEFIKQVHKFSYLNMDPDEVIWSSSMPAILPENESDIPLAYYGESFPGKLKTLYRSGLGYRYGRSMQTIAGMHFNFSFSKSFIIEMFKQLNTHEDLREFQDAMYFKLIRNFKRTSFILPLLFGASPVVDKSFLKDKDHDLEELGKDTYGLKYATSLRMGGLGYTSSAQENIQICYNKLPTYIKALEEARLSSYPPYEKIGLKKDGEFIQLNTNLLQIDNEFYSTIRPKHVALSGESALHALYRGGVEYIEVRLMDLNPYTIGGINEEGIRFLQHYLTYCLCADSPELSFDECKITEENFKEVVRNGRNPNCEINYKGSMQSLNEVSLEILDEMEELLACCSDLKNYFVSGINKQREKLSNYELLPSEKVLSHINENYSFVDHILETSIKLKEEVLKEPKKEEVFSELEVLKTKSFREEEVVFRKQSGDFETYLDNYFKQIKIKD